MIFHQQLSILKVLKSYVALFLIAFFLVSFKTGEIETIKKLYLLVVNNKIIEATIDKNTTDEQLLQIKVALAKDNFDFSYTVMRNANNEIKNLTLEISGGNILIGEVSSRFNSVSDNDTINPILIKIDVTKNIIVMKNENVSNKITTNNKSKSGTTKQVLVSTSNTEDYDVKILEEEGNGFMFTTTESNEEPLYYINGNKSDANTVKNLNESTIATINVLKGTSAIKKYGEEAKHGVVEITTKE